MGLIDEDILSHVKQIREIVSNLGKTDSIAVNKTSSGKFSFEVKLYGDLSNESAQTIEKLRKIYDELEKRFSTGEKE
jgi:hypothetical protein